VGLSFYFDEDSMSRALIRSLSARGIDVANAVDAGLSGLTDAAHLEYAAKTERVLYSFNVGDFYRLHCEWLRQGKSHAGLVLVPQQVYSIGEQMRRLLRLSASRSATEMRARIEFLSSWG
jgi:uncharacterized protein DUF5615